MSRLVKMQSFYQEYLREKLQLSMTSCRKCIIFDSSERMPLLNLWEEDCSCMNRLKTGNNNEVRAYHKFGWEVSRRSQSWERSDNRRLEYIASFRSTRALKESSQVSSSSRNNLQSPSLWLHITCLHQSLTERDSQERVQFRLISLPHLILPVSSIKSLSLSEQRTHLSHPSLLAKVSDWKCFFGGKFYPAKFGVKKSQELESFSSR